MPAFTYYSAGPCTSYPILNIMPPLTKKMKFWTKHILKVCFSTSIYTTALKCSECIPVLPIQNTLVKWLLTFKKKNQNNRLEYNVIIMVRKKLSNK